MQRNQPLFSIVIPTRNRGHLLGHALRSALEQNFADYEIVVVANDCQDNTREVVQSMQDERIRYFETEKMLTMPQNWEFAWTKSVGRYVIYLPDDDALVPTALRYLAENALNGEPPLISWEDAIYYYPGWHDEKNQNILLLFNHGDTPIEEVPAAFYRQQCARFEFAWSSPLPKMLNCAANRAFFEDWRGKLGQLFFPIAPDYSFAWIATHICSNIRVVHRPLTVRGISDNSIGSNAGLSAAGKDFLKEFGEFDFFANTLVEFPSLYNHLAATFLRINPSLRRAGIEPEAIDWERFLLVACKLFKEFEALVPHWDSFVPTLIEAAHKLSSQLGTEVETILNTPNSPTDTTESLKDLRQRTAKRALTKPPTLEKAASKYLGDERCARCTLGLEDGLLAEPKWACLYLFGDDLGAHSVYDMSRLVDSHYDLLLSCYGKHKQAHKPTIQRRLLRRLKAAYLKVQVGR